MEERRQPPSRLGDYSSGFQWSARETHGEESTVEAEDYSPPPDGSVLRIMWDETAGPLWGDEGLLPEEPEWLSRALGLSDSLIADLQQWLADMTAVHLGPLDGEWRVRQPQLNERGDQLAKRLQDEVGTRYRVRFRR